jgi:hypothetical protein
VRGRVVRRLWEGRAVCAGGSCSVSGRVVRCAREGRAVCAGGSCGA